MARGLLLVVGLLASSFLAPQPAAGIPVFAHRYGVSCQTCHSIVPELNAFGTAFRDAGFRWPVRVPMRGTFPIAVKTKLAYTSSPDPIAMPKAIVDEIELLAFGALGNHFSYRIEQYAVDGGLPGSTRDAFIEYNSNPMSVWRGGRTFALDVQAGQFTLPLPDDPETLRPTQNHYKVYDQTIGDNPFNFFDDRIGVNLGYGNRFAEVHAVAARGHDPHSGLPTRGMDEMFALRFGADAFSAWGYLYAGTRGQGATPDRFLRRALEVTGESGKLQTSLLLQTGSDSSPSGTGAGLLSSGGYLQGEWRFNDRLIGVVRYDSLGAAGGFLRSTTLTLNFRPYNRARWTIEDVVRTSPQTTHTLNFAWLSAY